MVLVILVVNRCIFSLSCSHLLFGDICSLCWPNSVNEKINDTWIGKYGTWQINNGIVFNLIIWWLANRSGQVEMDCWFMGNEKWLYLYWILRLRAHLLHFGIIEMGLCKWSSCGWWYWCESHQFSFERDP